MSAKSSRQENSNVLSHWYAFVEGVQFSAQEFYESIEKELAARKLPRLQTSRVEFHEESLVSDKRVYLRLARERFAFDVCAAPFGTGYFFSLRLIQKERSWAQFFALIVIALVVFLLCIGFATNPLWGFLIFAAISLGAVVAVYISSEPSSSSSSSWYHGPPATTNIGNNPFSIMQGGGPTEGPGLSPAEMAAAEATKDDATADRVLVVTPSKASSSGAPDADSFLLNVAVIGPLYERLRKDTYFRYDTRLLFHAVVSEIVKKKVEDLISSKGVKLVDAYEYNSFIGDLYKPAIRKIEIKKSEGLANAVA